MMDHGAWMNLASTLVALALVLALAWLTLRGLRHLHMRRNHETRDTLRLMQAVSLGPRERVVVLEHRNTTYLLGVTAGGIHVIDRWPAAAHDPAPDRTQPVAPS